MKQSIEHINGVMSRAEQLRSAPEVEQALGRLAAAIRDELGDKDPLVLCVMNGAVIPAGLLLLRLDFPLRQDYIHATRYAGTTSGGEIRWLARPRLPLVDRSVLIVDDILDEGHTLRAIQAYCRNAGVRSLHTAVLTVKRHERRVPGVDADFVGLEVPDRYVFGMGMDYCEYLRELDGIYALAEPDETT